MDTADHCLITPLLILFVASGSPSPLTPLHFLTNTPEEPGLAGVCCLESPYSAASVLHHFSHSLRMAFHLSVFLVKGFDPVFYQELCGPKAPILPCCLILKTYCLGVVDIRVHPIESLCCGKLCQGQTAHRVYGMGLLKNTICLHLFCNILFDATYCQRNCQEILIPETVMLVSVSVMGPCYPFVSVS